MCIKLQGPQTYSHVYDDSGYDESSYVFRGELNFVCIKFHDQFLLVSYSKYLMSIPCEYIKYYVLMNVECSRNTFELLCIHKLLSQVTTH